MRPVYLIGFMGVGKTTLGKKLASHMELEFIDLDMMFEHRYRLTVQAFFAKYGELLFRKFEQELLKTTFSMTNCIISTGGGTPCYASSMEDMCAHGLTVYMQMPPAALLSRLVNAKRQRPLLEGKSKEQLANFVEDKLRERLPYYSRAHLHVNAISLNISVLSDKIRVCAAEMNIR